MSSRTRSFNAFALVLWLVLASSAGLNAEEADNSEPVEIVGDERDRTGFEVRLQGAVGIPLLLGDRIESTPAYQASEFASRSVDPEPVMGVNAEVGWRFHPRLTAALHFEHLVDYSANVEGRSGPRAGDAVLTGKSSVATGDIRLYASTDTVQPYVIGGAGWMWVDTSDEAVIQTSQGDDPMLEPLETNIGARDGFVTRWGAGVDVFLSDSFFTTVQGTYVLPVGSVRDFDYVSVGWGFGYLF